MNERESRRELDRAHGRDGDRDLDRGGQGGPGRAGGFEAVDALRPEFESVDAFFHALLGVRSVCARLDSAFDELTGLAAGSTSAWARQGTLPTPDDGPREGPSLEPTSARSTLNSDDCLAVLLGLLAVRRGVERGFGDLAGAPASSIERDGGASSAVDDGRRAGASGSLLR